MSWMAKKTEHTGTKTSVRDGAFRGNRFEAKTISKKLRRRVGHRIVKFYLTGEGKKVAA